MGFSNEGSCALLKFFTHMRNLSTKPPMSYADIHTLWAGFYIHLARQVRVKVTSVPAFPLSIGEMCFSVGTPEPTQALYAEHRAS